MPIMVVISILVTFNFAPTESSTRSLAPFRGNPSGEQVSKAADHGSSHVDHHDRSHVRGPELKEELAVNGTLVRHSALGSSTFSAPIQDAFSRSNDHKNHINATPDFWNMLGGRAQ